MSARFKTFLAVMAVLALALPVAADEADDEIESPPPKEALPMVEETPPPPPMPPPPPAPPAIVSPRPEAADPVTSDQRCRHRDAPPGTLGEKTWKERINTVARQPLDRDLDWLYSRDRSEWRGFSPWLGIRDCRPLIARKTLGFHAPDPHRSRQERVLLLSRGPLRGPAPTE